jgi:DNA-binding CsgD family transcriptional regulator/PAS domain-containing protein
LIDAGLHDIIGLTYDAVIDPARWPDVLEAIRARHGWFNGSMSVIAMPQQSILVAAAIKVPDNFWELAPRHVGNLMAMWGGQARLAELPLEEPIMQSNVTDPAGWMDNPYFRELAYPQGIVDQVAMALTRDRTSLANIAFSRHESMTEIPARAIDELRLVAPHLRRAATISRILETMATRAATFEAALDATATGAVLVRGDMAVVHANSAAEAMMEDGDPIRVAGGRMTLSQALAPGQLETAVLAASRDVAEIGRRGIGIPARRHDGSPLVVHVMPLNARAGSRIEADAAVFVADTGGAEPLPTDTLSLLFGLTPAETRVFELAAAGDSPDQMAVRLGIAPSTVRTHLQRVYEKTGRHRQVELVALGRELKLLV